MNTYKVYFELYGKKMMTSIEALSEQEAKVKVVSKIKFHKVKKTDKSIYDKKSFKEASKAFDTAFDKLNKFFKSIKW